jgi:hypothetical protein
MNIESVYKAFLKFSKGSIKKDGFNLHITDIGKDSKGVTTFYFDFEPLGDMSYQKSGLEEVAWDEVVLFIKILGFTLDFDWEKFDVVVNMGKYPNPYLSKKFEKKINNILNDIKVVELCEGVSCVKIEVEHIKSDITIQDDKSSTSGTMLFFENFVRPIKGYVKMSKYEGYEEVSVEDVVTDYKEIQKYNRFLDSDTNYLSIDDAVGEETGLNDTNQVIYVLTRFVDEGNN